MSCGEGIIKMFLWVCGIVRFVRGTLAENSVDTLVHDSCSIFFIYHYYIQRDFENKPSKPDHVSAVCLRLCSWVCSSSLLPVQKQAASQLLMPPQIARRFGAFARQHEKDQAKLTNATIFLFLIPRKRLSNLQD